MNLSDIAPRLAKARDQRLAEIANERELWLPETMDKWQPRVSADQALRRIWPTLAPRVAEPKESGAWGRLRKQPELTWPSSRRT